MNKNVGLAQSEMNVERKTLSTEEMKEERCIGSTVDTNVGLAEV